MSVLRVRTLRLELGFVRLRRAAAPGGTGAAAVTTLGAVPAAPSGARAAASSGTRAPAPRHAFSAAKHRG